MKIIGITGSIASGKNFLSDIFEENGAAIFDADKEVHRLLESDKSTIDEVAKEFPSALVGKKIDRKILGGIVFSDKKKLQILESILHPKIREEQKKFLLTSRKNRKKIAVLNIPLLLENGWYKCDKIISIISSKLAQKHRFLKRSKTLTDKDFDKIISQQLSNEERIKRSDFVIRGFSKAFIRKEAAKIIKIITGAKN